MKKRRKNIILKFAVLAFAVYIAATLLYQAVEIKRDNEKLSSVKGQLTDQQKRNEQTERMLAENDEKFMESIATQLGYAKPNDRIFVDASGN